jgi:hypothetical protein
MAKRITYNILTGTDPHLGMTLYYSPYFDQNIWRRASSLTGERTKKDPAFKGFRQSSSRLKQASPIAASLYKTVPVQVRKYALYRTLTGEAIKMLKEGMQTALVTETLKKKYINPLWDASKKSSENGLTEEPSTRDRIKGMRDFTSYPQMASGFGEIAGIRRVFLRKKIKEGRSSVEYFSSTDSYAIPRAGRNISTSSLNDSDPPQEPKPKIKTTSGLIYMGRLPECRKFKIWVRPIDG